MDKELVSSFEAALKRFSTYEKSKPLPPGYAFIPLVNRLLRGNREWYKSTWPKHAPGPFDVTNVGSWFGDLKGRRIPWVQTKGESSGFPLVVRGFDSDQASAANKWAQRSMQWRYSFDDVRKQNEVRLAATSSTAIVPYDVGYAAKQSAKYGFVGPMPDESFYGPTRKGATGFEAHATNARLNKIKESFRFAMLDSDEQFIQGAMRDRGWSRDQAEQVYFKNLTENTKWLRLIGKNNPAIAKNLIPIAKAVGKASGFPIIGAFARNPALGAITALIGGGLHAGSYSLGRSRTLAGWMNARSVTGDISGGTFSSLAATGMSYEQMLQSLAKYSVKSSEARFGGGYKKYAELAKYGVDVSGLFNPYLSAEERRAEEYRVVSSANQADRAAIMATLGMSPEEFRSEKLRHTPRSKWSLSDLQLDIYRGTTQRMKENYPLIDFFIPNKGYELFSILAANKELEDRKFLGDNAVDSRREIYNLHKWDEVRETANVDDQYRAGMFDNSVTNNETDNGKSLTVINNWGGVSVEAKDTADFVDNLESTVGSKIIGSRYIAEAFDTRRIK